MLAMPHRNGASAGGEVVLHAAAGEPKQLWELPDSTHIRGLFSHPKEYQNKVLTFFDQALLPGNAD